MELFKAHAQWKSRPADERFWTLADMLEACRLPPAQVMSLRQLSAITKAPMSIYIRDGIDLVLKSNDQLLSNARNNDNATAQSQKEQKNGR